MYEMPKSEVHYRKALELRRGALGPEHPDTLKVVNQLGGMLYHLEGRSDECVALQRQDLETCRRVLGAEHPTTLEAVANLAILLNGRKPDEAESLYRENLDAIRRVWGDDFITQVALRGFAFLLSRQARWNEAESIHRERWERARRAYGPEHPFTLSPVVDLTELFVTQGELRGAEPLARQALERRRHALGPDNSETRRRAPCSPWSSGDRASWTRLGSCSANRSRFSGRVHLQIVGSWPAR